MGLRFRRRLGHGLFHLNVSKSGLSVSAGVPGATFNMPLVNLTNRRRNPRATVGLPGSGLSYSHQFKAPAIHDTMPSETRQHGETEIAAVETQKRGSAFGSALAFLGVVGFIATWMFLLIHF